MLATTYEVTANATSLTGKLIDCLLTEQSSPVHALLPGQLVSDYKHNGTIGFFLQRICPEDLKTFKDMVKKMPMPDSMRYQMSEITWYDSKKRLLGELKTRSQ